MAINKNSNGFTIGFAIVLVVVVGTILATISMGLSDLQKKNQNDKKRINILSAIGVEANRDNAAALFETYVKTSELISGKDKATANAFDVDIKKEFRDQSIALEDRNYPLYTCEKDGKTYYVIPMVGKGLWGPVWGFVSLEDDKTTIYGAIFDHKAETPGLGAEIKTPPFQDQYKGEKISSKIIVTKKGDGAGINSKVDAITGGTITSVGVEEMVYRTLEVYKTYFATQN
ncbi:MAG: NADH:ubiquinone reductase (Na(+)-transporting) subunit C [Flavobacteriales bacterium]